MKRVFVPLLLFALLVAACGSTTGPQLVAPSIEEAEPVVVAPAVDEATAVPMADQSVESDTVAIASFVPATAVSEAAIVRTHDHVLGSEDPIVVIIEYGDYQ